MSLEKQIDLFLANEILNSSITCILDENYSIYYSNDNFRSLIGFKEEEISGNFFLTLKSDDQPDTVYDFLIKTIEHGDTWKGELQLYHKEKHTLWLDTTITPIISEAGKLHFIATFIDISQRKGLINDLKQRAHRQGLIAILGQLSLNNIPIIDLLDQTLSVVCGSLEIETGLILELSINGKNALVRAGYNTRAITPGKTVISISNTNMLGYTLLSERPVICKSISTEKRFIVPETFVRENLSSAILLTIGDANYPFGIFSLLTSDSHDLSIDEIHFLQSVCNILAEAINRKNMEMSLRHERELSRKYLDVAEVMIIVIDTDEKILLANKYASNVLGYPQNKLRGMNFINTFLPGTIRAKCRNIFSLLLNNINYEISDADFDDNIIPVINKNDDIRYIKWKTTLLYNKDNEVNSLLSSGEDITEQLARKEEQRNLEKQLHQAQKMEAIGMLAGGIAHDFNNILASILGFSDLIIEKLNPDEEKLLDYITHIKNSGIKARDIIDQMQSINLQDEISVTSTPLPSLLKSTMKMLRSALPSTINLQINIEDDIPPVNINAATFNQLVMKLLINARNALQGHGDITISLSSQELKSICCTSCGQEINNTHVILSITDNGEGLTKENLAEAFKYITSTVPDSGLAYAIKATHDSGGHILINSSQLDDLYNEPGTNLQLVFNISHRQAPDKNSSRANFDSLDATTKHLMIIDDENSVASYLGELFKSAGFTVTVLCDSVDALDSFKQSPDTYDLVITDQTMPALTGSEFAAEALKIRQDLPIILCTGHSDIINRKNALENNIQGFVKKPVDSAELLHLVFNLLS